MNKRYSLLFYAIFFLGFHQFAISQDLTDHAIINKELSEEQIKTIHETIKEFKIFQSSGSEWKQKFNANGQINEFIDLPELGSQPVFLERSEILPSQNILTLSSGKKILPKDRVIPLKGNIGYEGDDFRLSINDDFLKGIFELNGHTYHIQPITDFIDYAGELYIIYNIENIIAPENVSCGIDNMQLWSEDIHNTHSHQSAPMQGQSQVVDCYIAEIAIACDYSFYQSNGNNPTAVENDLIARLNNTQTNYDDEFEDAIIYQVLSTFIVDQSGGDPWTSSTNSSALLNDFTSWGNGGGFGTTAYDIAGLWSGRNFDGSTIGLAWVNSTCGSYRYHILEDFSNNAELLRVLWSHEMGHNWSLVHDGAGSGYIMAPAVSTSTTWSQASIDDMDAKVNQLDPPNGCLIYCPPTNPIVADFTSDITNVCVGSTVQFYDLSTNLPTTWNWSFPGGNPSSSTERNPLIQYDATGTFEVSLSTSNSNSSDSKTVSGYITVGQGGETHVFFEDFENGLSAWTLSGNNNTPWSTANTNLGSGNVSLFMDNFNNTPGDVDEIESPTFSTVGYNSMRIEFMYAYTNKSNQHDSLSVDISTDGGATWHFVNSIAEAGNNNFRTTPTDNSPFNISERSDWCFDDLNNYASCLSFNIPNFVESYNTKIRLRSVSDNGNNLYIDHVAVIGDCYELLPPVAEFEADVTMGCAPLTVQFTDLSSNQPQSWSWTFSGGTPATSTLQNPTITYNNPGNYDVVLTVTNPEGTSSEFKQGYISVTPAPIADFTSSVNGLTVTFTNTSFGANTYNWDFGDGNTSSQENPTHTYASGGDYDVTLTITGDCGTDQVTKTVSLDVAPTADFTFNPHSGCSPLSVQYTDASSGATSWEWSFPGGNPSSSNSQNPTVIYQNTGIYDATLVVSNAIGNDTVTKSAIIEVLPDPSATFTYVQNQLELSFDATGQHVTSYSWDFGDGNTSSQEDPVHLYASPGTYTVVLTVTGLCGTASVQQTITINDIPNADFNVSSTEECVPATIEFYDNSSNADSWYWIFEGGVPATSTQQNVTVTYSSTGNFDVTLIATNSEGSDTIVREDYISIIDIPTPLFNVSKNGLMVEVTNSSVNATSYLWDFGDGNTSNQVNPTHTYSSNGTYTITLTATNQCGSAQTSIILDIGIAPSAEFTADHTEGCLPLTVQFNENAENESSYLWLFEGGTPANSTAPNPVVTYNNSGTFDVTLIVQNQYGSDTINRIDYITIYDKPVVDFDLSISGLNLTTINNTINADSYLWDFGDGNTSTNFEPTHTYSMEGRYTVSLTASNECGDVIVTEFINVGDFPNASFRTTTREGCIPFNVTFEDLSSNADTYSWTFQGGNPMTSTMSNPTVIYDVPGTYDVQLIVGNSLGKDTIIKEDYITVKAKPVADFTYTNNGFDFSFMNQSSGEIDTYLWNFGDGNTSINENPNHTYNNGQSYTVTLIVSNSCGADTIVKMVETSVAPTAAFTADKTTVCIGDTVHFYDDSQGNPTIYEWSFENGTPPTSSDENPVIVYNNPGRHNVTLHVENNAGSDEITLLDYVNVIDVPIADFEYSVSGLTVTLTNTSLYGTSNFWQFGNGESNNQVNTSITYPNKTMTYDITLIVENMCGSDTIIKQVDIIGEVATTEVADRFRIYPNPLDNFVIIEMKDGRNIIDDIQLLSIAGHDMKDHFSAKSVSPNEIQLSTENLPVGIYFLRIEHEKQFYFTKLIKH